MPMALANDAAVHDGEIVGDPTEAALVVLAAKGGLDVDETRRAYPADRRGAVRLRLQVPWRPSTSSRTTGARSSAATSRARRTCCSRARRRSGTWTARRSRSTSGRDQRPRRERPDRRRGASRARRRLASDFDPASFDPAGELLDEVQGLTLLALVAIVDPPRKEAKDAIARCKEAGIRARMITGDHVTTAGGDRRPARDRGPGDVRHGVRSAERRGARTAGRGDRRRRPRRAGGQGAARGDAQAARATSSR